MTQDKTTISRVWITLITNSEYLTGVLTLNYALRKVGTKYGVIALYTDSLPTSDLEILKQNGIETLKIERLTPSKGCNEYLDDPRFADTWTKLQSFSLFQFDKIVLLDSDMIILKNMDELFDLELNNHDRVFAASHACVCNPYKYSHYPKDWVKENCAFTEYHSRLTNSNDKLYGPNPSNTNLQKLNSGLLVIKPDPVIYDQILERLDNEVSTYIFPDQDLLADVFRSRWVAISYIYNYLKTLRTVHPNLDFESVKNIHYIIGPKPWNVTKDEFIDETQTFQYWWDINNERLNI